jgi:hypothetical protein
MPASGDRVVRARLKQLRKRSQPSWLRRAWKLRYLPRSESFLLVAGLSACVFVTTLFYRLSEDFGWVERWAAAPVVGAVIRPLQLVAMVVNRAFAGQMLLGIHSALTAAVFALLVAIAVSMHREEETDKTRVLLKASFVYPLALWAVLGFFTLMVRGDVPWKVLPPLVLGGFTAVSLSRVLLLLVDRNRLRTERTALLKDVLKRHMDVTEHRRIRGENLGAELEAARVELVYFHFPPTGMSYHNIYPPRNGVVTDLNLGLLGSLASTVEESANKAGYTFRDGGPQPTQQSGTGPSASISQGRPLAENKNRYLTAGYGDIVDMTRPIMCIDKRLISDRRVLTNVRRLARGAFTIEERYENLTESLQADLAGIKDQFAEAIRSGAQSRIDEYVRTYVELGTAFAEYLREWDGDRTSPLAKGTSAARPAMHETDWILSDIEQAITVAARTKSLDSIYKTGFLAMTIALHSRMYYDPQLFMTFMDRPFAELLRRTSDELDDAGRRRVVDALGSQVEQVTWVLTRQVAIELDDSENVPASLRESMDKILVVAQNLVRSSCVRKKPSDVRELLVKVQSLYSQLADEWRHDRPEIEMELRYGNPSDVRKRSLEQTLVRARVIEDLSRSLRVRRAQMICGLCAWLLGRRQREPGEAVWTDLYSAAESYLPSQLPELVDVYLSTHQEGVPEFWGWLWWEDLPHTGVFSLDRYAGLDEAFCIKALDIVKNLTDVDTIKLKPAARLAWAVSNEHGLLQTLDDLARPDAAGTRLLEDRQRAAIPALKRVFERVKKEYEDIELMRITVAPIQASRVEALASGVAEGFADGGWFRLLLKRLGKHEIRLGQVPLGQTDTFFGFSELRDKQEFVDRTDDDAHQRGKVVGEAVAEGEDAFLSEQLLGWCAEVSPSSIDVLLDQFSKKRDLARAVLLTTYTSMAEYVRDNPSYVPRYSDPKREPFVERQVGWIRRGEVYVPVVPVHVKSPSKGRGGEAAAIVDSTSIGLLTQYNPLPADGDPSKIRGQWYVDVRSMNNLPAQIDDFMRNAPDWLKKKGDETEQKRHLKSLVWLQVLERLTFDKQDDFFGLRLAPVDVPANGIASSGSTAESGNGEASGAA